MPVLKPPTAALLLLPLVLDSVALGFEHSCGTRTLSRPDSHPHSNAAAAAAATSDSDQLLPNPPSPASRLPVPPSKQWGHHVFLNFRGPDVRHSFSDHLYYALVRKGIKAFRDDRDLPRGENVTEAIPRAIEESKLSIAVLSRGYASSEWCLDELVKIMLTVKEKGHQLYPVFLQLSIDDVVNHLSSGCYKDDFDRHKKRHSYERVEKWSHALTSIADISGWVVTGDRSEAEMVEIIANNILWKVNELERDSSPTSQLIRPSETRDQQWKNPFMCEQWRNGESNPSPQVPATTREVEDPKVATRPPAAIEIDGERNQHTPALHPPDRTGDSTAATTPSPEEKNTTIEHHPHPAPAAAPKSGDQEEAQKKKSAWMSKTCSSNDDHYTRHSQADWKQELKYIKPEISPQGMKTVRIPKPAAAVGDETKKLWDLSLIAQRAWYYLSNGYPRPCPSRRHQINTTTILQEATKLWNSKPPPPPPSSSLSKRVRNEEWIDVKEVGAARSGLYIFTFSNQATRDRVVESSPWCIANATFVMRKWHPKLQLEPSSAAAIPVWVRLVGVPVEYTTAEGLSYIASALGKPLYMDRATATRSHQLGFAKVCVEMRLQMEQGLTTTIVVALGGDGDGGSSGVVVVVVRVLYQWRPYNWPCALQT